MFRSVQVFRQPGVRLNSTPVTLAQFGYRFLALELNGKCNIACSFCPHPIRGDTGSRLTLDDISSVFDQCNSGLEAHGIALNLFNEPLMYGDIWQVLKLAREKQQRLIMPTNGHALTAKVIDKLAHHPPAVLNISVQSLRRENHLRARPDLPYQPYLRTIAKAIAFLIDRPEFEKVDVLVAVSRSVLIKHRRLSRLLGTTDPGDPSIAGQEPASLVQPLTSLLHRVAEEHGTFDPDISALEANLDRAFQRETSDDQIAYQLSPTVRIVLKPFITGRRQDWYHPVQYSSCDVDYLGIRSTGDVGACCWDPFGRITLGNIRDDSLSTILQRSADALTALRRPGKVPFSLCKTCMGAPTRRGAVLRNGAGALRQILEKSS